MESKEIVGYKKLNLTALRKALVKKNAQLLALKKKKALGKLDNYYKIVRAKRDLARIKTFISLKEIIKKT